MNGGALLLQRYRALPQDIDNGSVFPQPRQFTVEQTGVDGTLNATDPRMDDYLRLSKDFISVLPSDYNGINSLDDLD